MDLLYWIKIIVSFCLFEFLFLRLIPAAHSQQDGEPVATSYEVERAVPKVISLQSRTPTCSVKKFSDVTSSNP